MRVPSVPGVFLHVQGRPAQWVISGWRDVGGERFRTTPVIVWTSVFPFFLLIGDALT